MSTWRKIIAADTTLTSLSASPLFRHTLSKTDVPLYPSLSAMICFPFAIAVQYPDFRSSSMKLHRVPLTRGGWVPCDLNNIIPEFFLRTSSDEFTFYYHTIILFRTSATANQLAAERGYDAYHHVVIKINRHHKKGRSKPFDRMQSDTCNRVHRTHR